MELKRMPIKRLTKKHTRVADHRDEQKVENPIANDSRIIDEYLFEQSIWDEAGNLQIFKQIDSDSDWKLMSERINYKIPVNYHKIPWSVYFLRIAALLILTFGLSYGFYRIITSLNNNDAGFTTQAAINRVKDIILPDGSSVTLNTGSSLSYRDGFGVQSREVIMDGEALFNVIPNKSLPFKVFIGESIVTVTGTSFSVREIDGAVKVSVLSGTVLLSSTDGLEKKISIPANHSGYMLSNIELKVEEGIPVNVLSWKTGRLVFDQTPIDSALMDIAHHFRKELLFETSLNEEITAEFQDQPLHEILDELKLVAGLQFDTTGTSLIVRK
jgi:ferric-dicitrate binding protein FerR (iron transport regulator)